MKNVTTKKENAISKKETAKVEAKQILANIKKIESDNTPKLKTNVVLQKVVTTPKTKTITTQDNATLKVVKEVKRGNVTREKNYIYSFQLDDKIKTNPKEEKKMRGKMRRQLKSILDKFIIDKKKLNEKENIKSFISFYKNNYILNDFTLQSLTNSSDELLQQDINFVLNIVKQSKEK